MQGMGHLVFYNIWELLNGDEDCYVVVALYVYLELT
jgi:hypothetical protein